MHWLCGVPPSSADVARLPTSAYGGRPYLDYKYIRRDALHLPGDVGEGRLVAEGVERPRRVDRLDRAAVRRPSA
ncbi:hypothetical protein GCM10010272_53230 [Streptomyces lateritius]|nr:hypothetical protein GCM10010272_53230 [Streptomyces lateritius]